VLRDRFLSTYQKAHSEAPPSTQPVPPPPLLELQRSASEPAKGAALPTRKTLLRATSGIREDGGLKLLEMAHLFQERLETNGKTDISMWQLDMHFERYAGDPAGALANCERLRRLGADLSPVETKMLPTTTFGFLRRIGLEEHAFNLEDAGFKLWSDVKHLSKDELKDKGQMPEADAFICHAVLTSSAERPDLLRKFHIPEFTDIMAFFSARFPHAKPAEARHFAVKLTDELGAADFSCFQIETYLKEAQSQAAAVHGLEEGLLSLEKAEAARKRPEAPPPSADPTCWVYTWLKSKELQKHADAFIGQNLQTREDLLDAPMEHKQLDDMGIKKTGDRCQILRYIQAERSQPEEKDSISKHPSGKAQPEEKDTPEKA